jgi:hypothetical protein
MRAYGFLGAGSAVILASATPALADPTYTLTLEDVGTNTSSTYSGTGVVNFTGTIGNFQINGLQVNDGNPFNPVDLSFTSQSILAANGPDTLNAFVTVSNLSAPVPGTVWVGTTTTGAFENSAIQGWAESTYFDAKNDTTLPAALATLLSQSSGGYTVNAFTSTTSGSTAIVQDPYSYTIEFSLDLDNGQFDDGAVTTDVVVPEPASFAMLAAGMLGLVMMRRKAA